MSSGNPAGRGTGAHLSLVAGTDRASWAERRPAVLRVCAGEATLLSEDEVDLVQLVNNAHDLDGLLLDDTQDPDDHHLAEVLMEHFCHVYGVTRHAKGDRLVSLISAYRRYLVPFLVESC